MLYSFLFSDALVRHWHFHVKTLYSTLRLKDCSIYDRLHQTMIELLPAKTLNNKFGRFLAVSKFTHERTFERCVTVCRQPLLTFLLNHAYEHLTSVADTYLAFSVCPLIKLRLFHGKKTNSLEEKNRSIYHLWAGVTAAREP